MSSAQNPDADREDYVVSVVEFAGDRGAATAALQRVFGIDEAGARSILNEVPVAVRRGVNRIRAEYFRRALELSGARVEIRDGSGEVVPAATAAARGQPSAPVAPHAQPSEPTAPLVQPGGPVVPNAQPSRPLVTRAQPVGPLTPRGQPSGPLATRVLNEPMPGVQLRSVSQPMAADAAPKPQTGNTITLGSSAANDTHAHSGGWGDLQPFKPAVSKSAPKAAPVVEAKQAPPPAAAAEEAWALSLEADEGPLDSPLGAPLDQHALELASVPSPARASNVNRRAQEPPALGFESDEHPAGPALELDVAPRTLERQSAPRYAPIPAGEAWRAPGAATLAKARQKQTVEALESGFGDEGSVPAPPAARPKPAARPASGDLVLEAGASAAAPVTQDPHGRTRADGAPPRKPIARPREFRSHLELGFWEAMLLGFSGTSISWIAKIAGASVVLAGLAQLSVRLPALGLPLVLIGLTCLLGLCGEYHRHVFWAAATRESALRERPGLSVATLMRDGIHLAGLALITQILLWFWLGSHLHAAQRPLAIVFSPTLWVLGFGPGFYWPIALASAAAKNRASAVWNFGLGLRALGRAPGQVATAVLVTAMSFTISLMIGAAIVNATSLDPTLALFTAAGLPIAITHALAGALMGRVVHARPDLFE